MKILEVEKREQLLQDEIRRITRIIKMEYDPEKIILFGSLVSEEVHEWSDIDLLIIKRTGKRPIERCMEVCELIQPRVGVDLFIYTPEEYKAFLKERYSFLMNILKEGKILYEKRG